METLIVGAGAVGQVFGRHLMAGGHRLTFFVKEKYAAEARGGFTMYHLNQHAKPPRAVRFEGFGVVSSPEEVAATDWDLVIFTISSTALRGAWLEPFLQALQPRATLVLLQPGLEDRAHVQQFFDPKRIVSGLISFISYQAPLSGESRFSEPGVAYWFPPMGPSPFSGEGGRESAVVAALRGGGLPSKVHPDVPGSAGFPSAWMMPNLVALEAAGWTFDGLRRGDNLDAAARASRQAFTVVEKAFDRKAPWALRLATRPFVVRLALVLSEFLIPIPMETYLAYHFTKVGDQTRLFMETYIRRGSEAGLSVDAIVSLLARLEPPEEGH